MVCITNNDIELDGDINVAGNSLRSVLDAYGNTSINVLKGIDANATGTSEQIMDGYTIGGGILREGSRIRYSFGVVGTTSGGQFLCTFRIKLGSTVVLLHESSMNDSSGSVIGDGTICIIDSSGTFRGTATSKRLVSASGTNLTLGTNSDLRMHMDAGSINLGQNNDIVITAQWDTASKTASCYYFSIYITP